MKCKDAEGCDAIIVSRRWLEELLASLSDLECTDAVVRDAGAYDTVVRKLREVEFLLK